MIPYAKVGIWQSLGELMLTRFCPIQQAIGDDHARLCCPKCFIGHFIQIDVSLDLEIFQ